MQTRTLLSPLSGTLVAWLYWLGTSPVPTSDAVRALWRVTHPMKYDTVRIHI